MWSFQTKPTYDEAVRHERVLKLLEFRRAKQMSVCDSYVATAAYLGSPSEFRMRLRTFMRRPDWRTRPIIPFSKYLERDPINVDIEPQPLKYWLRPDVCMKLYGEVGYNKMMEVLIECV